MFGPLEQSSVFPDRIHAAQTTMKEVLLGSPFSRDFLRSLPSTSNDPDTDLAVFEKTREEVNASPCLPRAV